MRLAVVVTFDVGHPDQSVVILEQMMPVVAKVAGFDGMARLVVADDVDHLMAWLDNGVPTPGGPSGSERT
jgi:hypothetical protein